MLALTLCLNTSWCDRCINGFNGGYQKHQVKPCQPASLLVLASADLAPEVIPGELNQTEAKKECE